MKDVEADSGVETEAGTTRRDVAGPGVVSIPLSFSVTPKWLKLLTGFKQKEKTAVDDFCQRFGIIGEKNMNLE